MILAPQLDFEAHRRFHSFRQSLRAKRLNNRPPGGWAVRPNHSETKDKDPKDTTNDL